MVGSSGQDRRGPQTAPASGHPVLRRQGAGGVAHGSGDHGYQGTMRWSGWLLWSIFEKFWFSIKLVILACIWWILIYLINRLTLFLFLINSITTVFKEFIIEIRLSYLNFHRDTYHGTNSDHFKLIFISQGYLSKIDSDNFFFLLF